MAKIKGQDDIMTQAQNMPHVQVAKLIEHELELVYKCSNLIRLKKEAEEREAELEKQLADARLVACKYARMAGEAEKREDVLREAFDKYGMHHRNCFLVETGSSRCTCGYVKVKAALEVK